MAEPIAEALADIKRAGLRLWTFGERPEGGYAANLMRDGQSPIHGPTDRDPAKALLGALHCAVHGEEPVRSRRKVRGGHVGPATAPGGAFVPTGGSAVQPAPPRINAEDLI